MNGDDYGNYGDEDEDDADDDGRHFCGRPARQLLQTTTLFGSGHLYLALDRSAHSPYRPPLVHFFCVGQDRGPAPPPPPPPQRLKAPKGAAAEAAAALSRTAHASPVAQGGEGGMPADADRTRDAREGTGADRTRSAVSPRAANTAQSRVGQETAVAIAQRSAVERVGVPHAGHPHGHQLLRRRARQADRPPAAERLHLLEVQRGTLVHHDRLPLGILLGVHL
eukprot:gene70-biopygen9075